jgi:thiosulfate reductase cytochrome b subunit
MSEWSSLTRHQGVAATIPNQKPTMNDASQRSIFRWIHIVFSIPILGYIYSPFEEIPNYAPLVRFVFLPLLILSGFWMWKGRDLRHLISNKSASTTQK